MLKIPAKCTAELLNSLDRKRTVKGNWHTRSSAESAGLFAVPLWANKQHTAFFPRFAFTWRIILQYSLLNACSLVLICINLSFLNEVVWTKKPRYLKWQLFPIIYYNNDIFLAISLNTDITGYIHSVFNFFKFFTVSDSYFLTLGRITLPLYNINARVIFFKKI